MRKIAIRAACGMALGLAAAAPQASAGTEARQRFLPLDLAMEAAAEGIRVCEQHGWHVTVTVVDSGGNIKVQAKGDRSTIHTKDASFRKAYTVVTMGPIFGFDVLGDWVEQLKTNRFAPTYAALPNLFLLPGAVGVKMDGEIVAAIGIGGAPGGANDEICAKAALAKIADRLN